MKNTSRKPLLNTLLSAIRLPMFRLSSIAKLAISAIALLAALSVNAAPVYKVTKGPVTVYIGGTFHLLTEADYPLQAEFDKAYAASNEVYFETDIGALDDPAFQMKILPYITYQDGRNLKTGLQPATFKRLDKYISSQGLSIQQFLPLNPTGIMLTLTMLEYQAKGFTAMGVDSFYYKKSKADNKSIAWFESTEEQLAMIDSFSTDDPDSMIDYTLEELARSTAVIDVLHDSWREGDMQRLGQIALTSFEDADGIYDVLIKNRNDAWMTKIEAMFGDEGTEFILVGALHLPGPDGVLTQLENKGYQVEKL